MKEYRRRYYQEHKEAMKASLKKWRAANTPERAAIIGRGRKTHTPEEQAIRDAQRKEKRREYYRTHKTAIYASNRKWQIANKEKVSQVAQNWKEENREHYNAYHREYRTREDSKILDADHRRFDHDEEARQLFREEAISKFKNRSFVTEDEDLKKVIYIQDYLIDHNMPQLVDLLLDSLTVNKRKEIYVGIKKLNIFIERFVDTMKNVPCADCGHKFDPCSMDFDHKPGTKSFNISQGIRSKIGFHDLTEEIAKCEVVCANCHRVRTKARFATEQV